MATEGLTYRQRLFVEAFLGEANGNATEAARMAGYAYPNKNAARLMVNDGIRAACDSRLNEAALTASEILARLSDHATATLDDFIAIPTKGPMKGQFVLDLAKAKKADRIHCVKKIKQGPHGLEIELYDAQAALDKLGKYRGLWKDPAPPDLSNATDEELERIAGRKGDRRD